MNIVHIAIIILYVVVFFHYTRQTNTKLTFSLLSQPFQVIEAQTPGMQDSAGPSNSRGENGEEDEEGGATEMLRPDLEHSARILLDDRMRYDPRRDWVATDLAAGEKGERIDEGGLIGVFEQKENSERQALQATRDYKNMMNAVGAGNNGGQHAIDDDDLDWS